MVQSEAHLALNQEMGDRALPPEPRPFERQMETGCGAVVARGVRGAEAAGSNPANPTKIRFRPHSDPGALAQPGEHRIVDPEVAGSSPARVAKRP